MVHNLASKKFFPSTEVSQLSGGSILSLSGNYYHIRVTNSDSGNYLYYPKFDFDNSGNLYFAGHTSSGDHTVAIKLSTTGEATGKKLVAASDSYKCLDVYYDKTNDRFYTVGYKSDGTQIVGVILAFNTSLGVVSERTFRCVSTAGRSTQTRKVVGMNDTLYIASDVTINDTTYPKGHLSSITGGTTANWSRSAYTTGNYYNYISSCGIDINNVRPHIGFSYNRPSAYSAVIVQYNSSGTVQWAKEIYKAGPSYESWYYPEITVCAGGTVYGFCYAPQNPNYFILFKISNTGSLTWVRKLTRGTGTVENNNYEVSKSIVADSNENVFFTFIGTDGTTTTSCVAKYNSSGTLQWVRAFYMLARGVGTQNPYGHAYQHHSIKIDSSNNVWLVGGNDTNLSDRGIGIIKYPNDGNLVGEWTLRNGDWLIIKDVTSLYTSSTFTDYTYGDFSYSSDLTNATMTTPTSGTASSPTYTAEPTTYLR